MPIENGERFYLIDNIIFGTDSGRVFADLTEVTYNHNRIKVHPLFLLFTQPFVVLLKGFTSNFKIAIIILESLVGSYVVSILYKIFDLLNIKKTTSLIFVLIYGLSFSQILFSAIPETFIFSCFWLITYWYFILYLYINEKQINKGLIYLGFIIFGTANFGMAATNYLSYLIGLLLYLLYKENNIKKILFKMLNINIINICIICFLSFFQKLIWHKCPIFLTSMFRGLLGKGYRDFAYMNFEINFNKLIVLIKNVLFYPIISPSIMCSAKGYDHLYFTTYNTLLIIIITMFYLIFTISFIIYINKKRFQKTKNKFYFTSLILTFCFNLIFHYFYGYHESFIYTLHFLFIIFIFFAFLLNDLQSYQLQNVFLKILILFLIIETINNICINFISAKSALYLMNLSTSIFQSIIGSLICFIILYFSLYLFELLEKKLNINILAIGSTSFLNTFLRNVHIFALLSLIVCIFIFFIYFDISIYKNYFNIIKSVIHYFNGQISWETLYEIYESYSN